MKVLQIKTSLNGDNSMSNKLSNAIVDEIKKKHSSVQLTERNLAKKNLPHFSLQHFEAFSNNPEMDVQEKEKIIKISDELINEIEQAEIIVIGVPVYNLTIPSTLKSWIDFITRAQKTFRYTTEGPIGLITDKKVYIAISSGGIYSDGSRKSQDFTEPYLRTILGFLGINDITTIRVEGLSIPDINDTAFSKALQRIEID
ncbi:hypothetical protein B6A10_11705 [Flavobacterium sp. L1I52]|uniref:FMN dependent NADH:quinone oxidoreductase n=1 Tax=Flavobacterium pokkalii TaxID=1940408 RepID=A0ABR7UT66_9FLAO|nr:NAD(P)H-dependent oxidoreductase [Flavobacterium pokkalii]MBD0725847.1 hypothetical protein [Flavobacterium pokkalii]